MIKIREKQKVTTLRTPYYSLTVEYMIGDADGDTEFEESFPIEAGEVLEKFCRILDKLSPLKGTWGIVFRNGIKEWFEAGQVTQEDMNFWKTYVDLDLKDGEIDEETDKILDLIGDTLSYLIRGETDYSFLVYQDYILKYVDEYGEVFNTYFE